MPRETIRSHDLNIKGLAELNKALKQLPGEVRSELKATNRQVAAHEAGQVRSAAEGLGSTSAKAAASIGVVGSYQSAGIAFGGAAYPYAAGAAFGGQGRPTTQQFKPWKQEGYWPFPQIKRDGDSITDTYVDALNKIIERAFPQ